MEFIVRQLAWRPDTILVRYDCACGCKPNVEYLRGSDSVEHEHCCCGNLHFVGKDARHHLDAYLAGRSQQHLDDDLGGYRVSEVTVDAPWGEAVPVAYALPAVARKH
ncbi:MAG: hypothetical protein EXR51_11135 [Dehalococcoidia bacterium]|nr:hypothetical protein [Dehalococcoidia bacterium]